MRTKECRRNRTNRIENFKMSVRHKYNFNEGARRAASECRDIQSTNPDVNPYFPTM